MSTREIAARALFLIVDVHPLELAFDILQPRFLVAAVHSLKALQSIHNITSYSYELPT